jgi:hypothetical protein
MEPEDSLPCSQVPFTGPYPVHTTPSCLSEIHLNIILLPTSRSSQWSLLACLSKSYMHSSSPSCMLYMPCQSHPHWLDHSNYTWRSVQVMKLLIMQFPPTSYHFLSILSSNTLSLCSSPNVRDQVSHPYNNTGKIVVLYIHIFTFLDCRWEDKRFWTQWQQALSKLSL